MFCGNCGKEIIGNTKFCQYCGAEQTAVVIPAAGVPAGEATDTASDISSTPISSTPVQSTPLQSAPLQSTPLQSTSVEPNITSMGVPSGESVPAAYPTPAAETGEPSGITSLPTPNSIPTSNIGLPETAVRTIPAQPVPAETAHQTEITIKDEEKRPPERKYSLKHIVMCLAAAAVMAVAAGVFAGLYFSVILS